MNTRLILASSTALLLSILNPVMAQEPPKPIPEAVDNPTPGLDTPPKKYRAGGPPGTGNRTESGARRSGPVVPGLEPIPEGAPVEPAEQEPSARTKPGTLTNIPGLEPIPEGVPVEPAEEEPSARTGPEIIREVKLKVLRKHYEETLSETIQLEKATLSASAEERTKMEAKATAMRGFLSKLEADLNALAKQTGTTGKSTGVLSAPKVPGLDEPGLDAQPETEISAGAPGDTGIGTGGPGLSAQGAPGTSPGGYLVPKARAELEKVKKLEKSGLTGKLDVIKAETRLKWAEASAVGDRAGAARATRDGAKRRLELMRTLFAGGVVGAEEIEEIERELRAAEADLRVQEEATGANGETDDERATRLARAAHAKADAFAKLPRLDYQVQYRYGVVDTLRVVDATLETMGRALIEPVRDEDWIDYEWGFSWDEKRLISEMRPGKFDLAYHFIFGTAGDSWSRHEGKDHKHLNFFRGTGIGRVWNDPKDFSESSISFFQFAGYPRLTPHRFWWGPSQRSSTHTLLLAKLDEVVWKYLGTETVGEEVCDIVEATYLKNGQKAQGLWISQKSGHARRVVSYYADSKPNELIRFDDFREISPGVWMPFREARTFAHSSDTTWRKRKLFRGETIVSQIRTDRDLAAHYAELLPKEGDRVQDMRFGPYVDLPYSAKRSDDEISQLAETKRKEQLKGREQVQHIVKPLEDLVGKAAPTLPADGWLGGGRPDLEGKPYLIYFWATWSRECKPDLYALRILAGQGVNVIGIHPAGTPAGEIEKVIYGQKLKFPTLVAPDERDDKKQKKLGGYPYTMLAYSVLVDAFGRVAAHGSFSDVNCAASDAAFVAKMGAKPTPALEASRWLNTSAPLTLDSLKGKTVLLDFWGQWSGPCVKHLARCEELHTKFKDRGLVVIGVHSAHRPDNLDALLKDKKVTFPVMIDRGESADRFQINTWPSYVLIDKAGKIAWGFSQEPPSAAVIEDFLSAKEQVIP